ncbi:GNAT family N-acetyltransferase [Roseibium sp. HPY-6]|uniref:GNAT family N-acetyltransferase n=1 Tax=Roseibium sp. HPY-6 TaxID=3229852 RepID=UPI00338ED1F4
MAEVTIRALARSDRPSWEIHWADYLAFYEQDLDAAVTDGIFERLLEAGSHSAFVAMSGGEVIGFVHYLFHDSTWSLKKVCYLEDLYVSSSSRGSGAGRKLIEAVYEAADKEPEASGKVYWHTDRDNKRAQLLYDRIGELSDSIRYVRR